jgi:uncharacterized membrane protein
VTGLALGVAAVSAAAMGGVFFAFSTFVMAALGRLPPAQGMAAMQEINRTAPTPWFMVPLFGTAALGIGVAVGAAGEPGAALAVAGAAVYLAGVVLTVAYHVPRRGARPARHGECLQRAGLVHVPAHVDGRQPSAHPHLPGGGCGVGGRAARARRPLTTPGAALRPDGQRPARRPVRGVCASGSR